MVILNKAKGIRVGGGLVKSVTVGTKKIWPSRVIVGYKVALEFVTSIIYDDGQMDIDEKPKALSPYLGVENLRVRKKGGSQSLAAKVIKAGSWAEIECEASPSTIGITAGTVCELLEPIYENQ